VVDTRSQPVASSRLNAGWLRHTCCYSRHATRQTGLGAKTLVHINDKQVGEALCDYTTDLVDSECFCSRSCDGGRRRNACHISHDLHCPVMSVCEQFQTTRRSLKSFLVFARMHNIHRRCRRLAKMALFSCICTIIMVAVNSNSQIASVFLLGA